MKRTILGLGLLVALLVIMPSIQADHDDTDNHPPDVKIRAFIEYPCNEINLFARVEDKTPVEDLDIFWVTFRHPKAAVVRIQQYEDSQDKQFAIACVDEPGEYRFAVYVTDPEGLQTLETVDVVITE